MQAFRRYTNLADLIYILRKKRITLRDPLRWDDRNDAYYLEKYKEYKRLQTLLALCFVDSKEETYHHWRVFASGANGVCIRFKRDSVLSAFQEECEEDGGLPPFEGPVEYDTISGLEGSSLCVDDLPFRKWYPYGDEREYRIIYASKERHNSWGFDIQLQWIEHISLSPWLPKILADPLEEQLRSICGCMSISRSRVTDFDRWKAVADNIVGEAARSASTGVESFDPIQLAGAWPGDEPLDTLMAKLD